MNKLVCKHFKHLPHLPESQPHHQLESFPFSKLKNTSEIRVISESARIVKLPTFIRVKFKPNSFRVHLVKDIDKLVQNPKIPAGQNCLEERAKISHVFVIRVIK
jgi:hypothetical protein